MAVYYGRSTTYGTGDGSSWANADSHSGAISRMGIGDTLHLSAGTISGPLTLPGSNTVYGGYDDSAPESDPANRDFSTNRTLFDAGGTLHALRSSGGGGTYFGGDLVDGCDFTNGYDSLSTEGAWFRDSGFGGTLRNCRYLGGDSGGSATEYLIRAHVTGGPWLLENCVLISPFQYACREHHGNITMNGCTVVMTSASATAVGYNINTSSDGHLIASNSIFSGVPTGSSQFGGLDVITYSCVETAGWTGTGNISDSPDFVGGGDYSLQSTSACIGAADSGTSLSTDSLLVARDANPDMGAFEYVGASTPTLEPDVVSIPPTVNGPTVAKATPPNVQPDTVAAGPSVLGPTIAHATVPVVAPDTLSVAPAVLGPSVALSALVLAPETIAVGPTVLGPAVAHAAVPSVAPDVAAVAPTVLGPTIAPATVPALAPDAASVAPTILGPTIAIPGGSTVSPDTVAVAPAVLGPTVAHAAVPALAPDAASVAPTILGPTIAPASVPALAPDVASVAPGVLGPTVAHAAVPAVAPDAASVAPTILGPTIAPQGYVQPDMVVVAPTILGPTLAPATVPAVAPDAVSVAPTLPGPTLAPAAVPVLEPVVLSVAPTLPGPTLVSVAVVGPDVVTIGVTVLPVTMFKSSAPNIITGLASLAPVVLEPFVILASVSAADCVRIDPRDADVSIDTRDSDIYVRAM